MAPTLGYFLLATWRTTPFGTGLECPAVGGAGRGVFLPGLWRHHALRLRAGYQWQDQLQYQFAPAVSFPRGEGYTSFDRLSAASVDYFLPLGYTHWDAGPRALRAAPAGHGVRRFGPGQ